MKKQKYDLEDRLVDYAVRIIKLVEALPKSHSGLHLGKQLLRSGTSPAANYGEAQSAESRKDFIHKLKISLKELKETRIWLKIIIKSELIKPEQKIQPLLEETEELIAIIFKSIQTVRKLESKQ
ncbi:four helix bundle protein [candidate division KSB1 bacterium]|nr:four helix bundle protein [candidate division KSB1 bacterium]